jgi:iron complex transport system substrate-binding protein
MRPELRLLWSLPLLLAGCSTEAGPTTTSIGEVRAVRSDGTPLSFAQPPRQLVPVNAAALEYLAALVEPERIAALPSQATTYSSAPLDEEPWRSLPTFSEYSAEVLLAHEPELVVTHAWQDPIASAFLRDQGVGVAVLPELLDLETLRRTIRSLGALLQADERAEALVADLDRRIAALRAAAPEPPPRAIVYTNYGTGGWTAGSGTPEDLVMQLAGLRNLAAEAGFHGHVETDLEALIRYDPELVIVCAAGEGTELSGTRAYLDQEPSLRDLRFVREGRIVVLPVRLYSTASHHVVEAAEEVVAQSARFPVREPSTR